MTEAEWTNSTDPRPMLNYLLTGRPEAGDTLEPRPSGIGYRPTGGRLSVATDRKLRLFACACCRAVWDGVPCLICEGRGYLSASDNDWDECDCSACHGTGKVGGLTDPRSRRAVEVAERYADGEAIEQERETAFQDSIHAVIDLFHASTPASLCCRPSPFFLPGDPSVEGLLPATQAALLKCLFGNPFRPFVVRPEWLLWNDRCVPRIAAGIYGDRAFGRLPILHDALLDSGCDDDAALSHCRENVHARGCFLLDALLGKC